MGHHNPLQECGAKHIRMVVGAVNDRAYNYFLAADLISSC
jgi:hypothetical protein